jgi:hypothetical protein
MKEKHKRIKEPKSQRVKESKNKIRFWIKLNNSNLNILISFKNQYDEKASLNKII